jgi:hypothetical protein
MKRIILLLVLLPRLISAQIVVPNYPAVDALGRKLPDYQEVGPPKKDKFVGLFYWVWHTNFAAQVPLNASEIYAKHPEAIYQFDNPVWRPQDGTTFHWGEPLMGYYRDEDPWMLRKQAIMLADAGIDVVILDSTNGLTFKESYEALFKAFDAARKDGIKAPAIAFILPFGPNASARAELEQLYNDLYKPGLYKDLWFYWEGKPLIMAYREMAPPEMGEFFTFRPGQPVYDKGPQQKDHWGWLEIYPQHGFGPKPDGTFEEVTVGVAQNWTKAGGLSAMNSPGAFGRSYTDKDGMHTEPGAVNYGYNFQEQWEQALKINPDFIFITGWNEWVAGRAKKWMKQMNAFPDEFNQEFSRDIEPMKGGHGDNYYYQMIANIRKFKGVAAPVTTSGIVKAKADGFVDWSKVMPEFTAHKGSAIKRDFDGFKGEHYINTTGRNDIVSAKVANDKQFVYFYVQTQDKLSPVTDKAWMRLFINTDCDSKTGWNGYDYVINRVNPTSGKAIVERSTGGWNWAKAGVVDYRVSESTLEIKVPRTLLKQKGPVDIEFKWSDNMQGDGDAIDFIINGDVAPSGRFNYHYVNKSR